MSPTVTHRGRTAVAILIVGATLTGCTHSETTIIDESPAAYARGVNDALDRITLLSLEQRIVGTNRTWGEMGQIVASRLKVERTSSTK